jgi:predicted SAM-dependent methyltransferase
VDEIYAGHVLEHFDWRDGERALGHWVSMLRPGGKISVSVPDYDMLCRTYLAHPTAERLREFNDRYIYSYIQKSPHKYAYNEALLEDVMMRVGLVSLKRMPVDHEYFPHAVDWQVGIEGRKRISCG